GRRLHWWTVAMAPEMRRRNGRKGTTVRADAQALWAQGGAEKWPNFAPYLDLPREIFEDETDAVHAWLKAPHTDPWALDQGVPRIEVPNLNVIGWWDHCNGRLLLDQAIREKAATETARTGSRTIIGPWGHAGLGQRRY